MHFAAERGKLINYPKNKIQEEKVITPIPASTGTKPQVPQHTCQTELSKLPFQFKSPLPNAMDCLDTVGSLEQE